ncbi:MAG: hypothetical protein LRY51_06885 [Geovibrio sp.]|nr:hypothetical protein [Geovibrio sp.]
MERDSFRAYLTHLSETGRLETASEPVSCDLEAAESPDAPSAGVPFFLKTPQVLPFPLL